MTGLDLYQHDRDQDRYPGGHYIGPDRPRAEMAAAWEAGDPPDDVAHVRLGRGLTWEAPLAVLMWFVVGIFIGLALSRVVASMTDIERGSLEQVDDMANECMPWPLRSRPGDEMSRLRSQNTKLRRQVDRQYGAMMWPFTLGFLTGALVVVLAVGAWL